MSRSTSVLVAYLIFSAVAGSFVVVNATSYATAKKAVE